MRLEVVTRKLIGDGRARRLAASLARDVSAAIDDVTIVDVYLLVEVPDLAAGELVDVFSDAVAQELLVDRPVAGTLVDDWDLLIEVASRPGVTDPVALTAREALRHCLGAPLPEAARVQTATQYLLRLGRDGRGPDGVDAEAVARALHNPLIQTALAMRRADWDRGARPPARYPHHVPESPPGVASFDLASMDDAALAELSRQRLLALSPEEMSAVRAYAVRRGRPLTDVELEMVAQTWSEHCKHKIFNATIHHREPGGGQTIRSLFRTYIRATTEAVARRRRFLRSVFHDNSGVVAFDRRTLLCFKVETHNSPSALDPYGGAITGIVGVNRDIIGTGLGARPIFNTNVLCFGPPDTPAAEVPAGLLAPARVMAGVHRGIVDGGNQSGIPVVAGALLFDESYLGKPLVFCGTGGILPVRVRGRRSWVREASAGDAAVMVGGRIGKDGIHGATFSSEELSEASPTSAVQIGDPITQKKALDFLLEARDLGLYRGLTDNGAGGLSSSLGEMATLSGGVRIDLDRCPLKYAGLAPWEILLSESQERMSVAVPPRSLDRFLALAGRRDVQATVVGTFTASGRVEVIAAGATVADVDLAFLHEGLPVMDLRSEWRLPPGRQEVPQSLGVELASFLLAVLGEANVASKEPWVRQYDHEVQGRSVVKPFVGEHSDAPSDGAVLRVRPASRRGITVTHGICPRYGDGDPYAMAQCAVDEAVRAHVALGGDPARMAGLDNFCWPDPVEGPNNPDGAFKLGQLVRTCRGLADICRAYLLPLISGKDSMKNDARVGGRRISVRPTLLVSLLGVVADVRRAVTTDFKRAGDPVYLIGETRGELGGTIAERLLGRPLGACPSVRPAAAMRCYRRLHRAIRRGLVASCHDLADGGLWAALAESAIGGDCGVAVELEGMAIDLPRDAAALLVCETPSRLLASVPVARERAWRRAMRGVPLSRLGTVTEDRIVRVAHRGRALAAFGIEEVRAAWCRAPGASPEGGTRRTERTA